MTIALRIDGPLAHISMDDGKANAINADLLGALGEALDQAEAERSAILLSGRDGFFSGGLDLKTLPTLEPDALVATLEKFTRTMLRLFMWPRPVVAACTGHAIAGGTVTLLACDERIAADGRFKIGLNETAIGLSLPRFVVEIARCQIPAPSLRPVVLQGELFAPVAAREIGLIDEVVAPDALLERARSRAIQLAELPRDAYADTKRAMRSPAHEVGIGAMETELGKYRTFFQNVTG